MTANTLRHRTPATNHPLLPLSQQTGTSSASGASLLCDAVLTLVQLLLHLCRLSDIAATTALTTTNRSYKEWKQDKEHGTEATQLPDAPYAPGTGPSSLGGGAGAGGSGSGGGSSSSTSVGDAVRGLGHEAGDTVQATHEVVKMEGQAAGGFKKLKKA